MTTRPLLLACLVLALGCADGQSEFTSGRTLVSCDSTVPVCSTTAGCVLDGSNYMQGSFAQGATVRAVVHTDGAALVKVDLYFVNESSPGIDTEITFYEAECLNPDTESSNGQDIFAAAGPQRIWSKSHQVTTAGDHLIEVFSDAQADYLLRVTVQ